MPRGSHYKVGTQLWETDALGVDRFEMNLCFEFNGLADLLNRQEAERSTPSLTSRSTS